MANQEIAQLAGEHICSHRGVRTPYLLQTWLTGGAFGQIYQGINENTGEQVAVKLERKDAPHRQLYLEFGFYARLRGAPYTPRILYFGSVGNWNALTMDLLGPSLMNLFKTVGRFSSACTAATGIRLLEIFQDFHNDKGLIFRDIKPENFLVGPSDTDKAFTFYLIDLGLAKEWRPNGEHIPFVTGKVVTGTLQYISVNMHKRHELSRRDDLESIMYVLIFLHTGTLPWLVVDQECRNNQALRMAKYGEIKMKTPLDQLCANMPSHFKQVFKAVRKLKFDEEPDYQQYIDLFGNILADRGLDKIDRAFDWNQSHTRRPHKDRQKVNRSNSRTRSSSQSPGASRSKEKRSSESRRRRPSSKKRDGKNKNK